MNLFRSFELPELFTFLLPGIIIGYLYQLALVGNKWEYSKLILNCLVLATVYSILIKPIFNLEIGFILPAYVHNVLYFLLLPSILGVVGITLKKAEVLRNFLGGIGIKLTHPIDTAWDYTFYETLGSGRYCIVTLKEGTKVYGYLGPASFIGSGNGNHDLLLENIFDVKDTVWSPLSEPKSAYINSSEIMTIELLYDLENTEEYIDE